MYSHYFKPNVKAIKRVSKPDNFFSENTTRKHGYHIQIEWQADINCK